MTDEVNLPDNLADGRNKRLFAIESSDDIDIVAAGFPDIHHAPQFASIGGKLRELAEWDKQILAAQRLGGISIVDPAQLQNNHLAFIWSHAFNFQAAIVRAKMDGLKLSKAIGDIGQRADLQLAPHAKKGHHLSNSS